MRIDGGTKATVRPARKISAGAHIRAMSDVRLLRHDPVKLPADALLTMAAGLMATASLLRHTLSLVHVKNDGTLHIVAFSRDMVVALEKQIVCAAKQLELVTVILEEKGLAE